MTPKATLLALHREGNCVRRELAGQTRLMSQASEVNQPTKQKLVDEFEDHVHLSAGGQIYVRYGEARDFFRRAGELGCLILGFDGIRVSNGVFKPDLDLIFHTSNAQLPVEERIERAVETAIEFVESEVPEEDNMYLAVALAC